MIELSDVSLMFRLVKDSVVSDTVEYYDSSSLLFWIYIFLRVGLC